MKAITIWPEWAALIAAGVKTVENRTWRPPEALIGQRIAIHAGAHIGGRPGKVAFDEANLAVSPMAWEAGYSAFIETKQLLYLNGGLHPITAGAVVATSILGEPYRPKGGPWETTHPDSWCWPLRDIVPFRTPFPYHGKQGLWDFPMDWSAGLVCPKCGVAVKYSIGARGIGMAECQDGRTVSRRWPSIAPEPCDWNGALVEYVNGRLVWSLT